MAGSAVEFLFAVGGPPLVNRSVKPQNMKNTSDMKSHNPRHRILTLLATGILAPIACTNLTRFIGEWGNDNAYYVFVITIYLLIGIVIGRNGFREGIYKIGILYLLMPFGIFADVIIDFTVRNYDRNLWPFEIIIMGVLALLPVLTGCWVGSLIKPKSTTKAVFIGGGEHKEKA